MQETEDSHAPAIRTMTHGLSFQLGKLRISMAFSSPMTIAQATRLSEVVTRWAEQYGIGDEND